MRNDDQALSQLEIVLDHLSVGLVVCDDTGAIVLVNPTGRAIHGLAADQPFPADLAEFARDFAILGPGGEPLPPDQWPVQRVFGGEQLRDLEVGLRHRVAGWVRTLSCGGTLARDHAGRPLAVLTLADVSERREAEARRRASEEQFRQLAEAMPQLVWTARPDGQVDYYNGRVREFAGIQQRGDGTWLWEPVVREDHVAATTAAWERALATGEPYEIEHPIRCRDGEYRWFLSRGVPARDEQGRITRWYGTATDVHEARLAATAARQQAELLDLSSEAIFVCDFDGVISYWNLGAELLYGYRADEVQGRLVPQLLRTRTEVPVATIRDALAHDGHWRGELIHHHRTGRALTVETRMALIGRDGRRLVLEINRDVTERKQNAEALYRSEERFRRLVEASSQIVWVVEPTGETREDSPSWRAFTGRTYQEYAGWRCLEAVHPDDRETVRAFWQRTTAGTEAATVAFRLLQASGQYRHLEAWAVPVLDQAGRVREWIVMGTDVTERRQAEQDRLEFERQLQQTQKLESLGVLAGGVAHDFNNLLTSVLGNADLALMDVTPGSPLHEVLGEIRIAATRAADLSRQMLAYTGRGRFTTERLDLADVVWEISRLLHASVSRKAKLEYNFGTDVPPVAGDATQIRQVVMNLLTNASEALGSAAGRISLRTTAREFDEEALKMLAVGGDLRAGRYVVLEVADTGCGMDDSVRSRIFEPFFSTKFTGRGLGLAAVMGIVRAHRGGIRVESQPGEGTVVTVILPAADHARPEREALPEAPIWRGSGVVLLVDDEAVVRNVGQRMLGRLGFEVLTADGGREAVEIFGRRAAEIRCVILDLTMPDLDGAQTLALLRRIRPDVPVILASGYDVREARQRFAAGDLTGFLAKPFTVKSVTRQLKHALRPAEDAATT